VQNYMIANNLMSAQGATLTEQEISNLSQTHASVKVDLAEAEARLATARRQLAAGSTGEDVGEALNSQVIKDLRNQRAQVSRRIAEMESRYGPLHPEIIKAKRELQDIDAQINSEIQRIISNLEAQASVQRQRAASVAGSVGQARGKLVGNNRALVRLNELQREAEASRTLYESYLGRFKQTAAQEGIEKTDARIVSKASLPTGPSSPKRKLALMLALVCGFGVAVAAVLVRRALDSGLVTGSDVESLLDQSYLAGIAAVGSTAEPGTKITTEPLPFIQQKPLSVFAEGFRSLRASLLYSRLGGDIKVIALTSSLPGEGKTTTAVCLAQVMVQSGQSVIVVDCDLRRRSIKDVLGVEVDKGMLEVLSGSATLDEAIITDAHGVHYLPLAKSAYTPKEVFGSEAMDTLLAELRERYDTVILDTAPVLAVVDTRILARKADITVMLLRWRKTPRKAVAGALNLLADSGVRVGGVALTQIDVREQARYGYGDNGYYYNAYKKYYTE
ncbi:MAG: polysaccharide biosynthesis tyrosine autokinase, partial [Asticcacaulis sp.]